MRFRTKADQIKTGTRSIHPTFYLDKVGAPPTHPALIPISWQNGKVHEVMVDEEILNFKQRSAKGELFFNTMYQELLTWTCAPTTWDVMTEYDDGEHPQSYYYENFSYYPSPPLTLLTSLDTGLINEHLDRFLSERDIAVAKAWSNVDESELLAYATLGELPETVAWIGSLFQRGIKVLAVFRKRQVKIELKRMIGSANGIDTADALANLWLEMRYALRPLMFEMEQIINALNNNGSLPRKTARGFHRVDEDLTDLDEILINWYTGIRPQGSVKRQSVYRAGVLYNINITDKNWASVLGLDKPLEAIYELTKLSFMLDWFFNIGDVLAGLTPNANLTPLGSWVKETHTYSFNMYYGDIYRIPSLGTHWTRKESNIEPGFLKATHTIVRRVSNPSKVYFPSCRVKLDVAKLLDIAAIARGFYRSFTHR